MADRSLKAVIQAVLDPSGVVKGVAAASKEIDKLNAAAKKGGNATDQALANAYKRINPLKLGITFLKKGWEQFNAELERANELGKQFSTEGMTAAMRLQMAQLESERRIGKSAALSSATEANRKAESVKKEAAFNERNAASLEATRAFWGSLKSDFNRVMQAPGNVMRAAGMAAAGQMPAEPPESLYDKALRIGLRNPLTSFTEYGGELASSGSTRGMPYDPAVIELQKQTKILKGN
jgi:hypothetical protein